ncbi:MAG: gamma-glutamyl-gamma-aminobutyrate hydrolase family protein [Terracidiphilus sp.]
MSIRIAIPEPTTADAAYNARSLPLYISALQSAGATPVVIPLHERQDRVARVLAGTQGVLLPGSGFDVDPERYGEKRIPACGPADPGRTAVDELLLQDAFNLHKPILAICHGAQTLNVWLNGTLIQDLKTVLDTPVNHAPGRDVVNAHSICIASGSRLSSAVNATLEAECNSSHHQAIGRVGDNLRVTAVCPQDKVIEAIELDSADHFAVGVQWHPERTYTMSSLSHALFAAFIQAAETWHLRPIVPSAISA